MALALVPGTKTMILLFLSANRMPSLGIAHISARWCFTITNTMLFCTVLVLTNVLAATNP